MTSVVSMVPREQAESSFDKFWRWCPKKVEKPKTQAKFNAIVNGGLRTRSLDKDSGTYVEIELRATPEELIEGMKRYARSIIDPKTFKRIYEDRFICHPATWLNQGRWMDG